MPELPRISGDEVIKVFKALGFYQVRQKGSHVVMRREDKGCVIPRHKQLAVGTLKEKTIKILNLNRLFGLKPWFVPA